MVKFVFKINERFQICIRQTVFVFDNLKIVICKVVFGHLEKNIFLYLHFAKCI